MGASIQDVLKVNLVLVGVGLLNDTEELNAFRRAVDAELSFSVGGLTLDAQQNIPEPSGILTLHRDRINLERSLSRTTIGREYPSSPEDLNRLAEVAGQAIESTSLADQRARAFGYNIELVYDQDSGKSAFQYLAQRLFPADFSVNDGWGFIGGSGKLVFEDGERRYWGITIEPRFNAQDATRVFLNLNLHVNEQRLPRKSEVESHLHDVWRQARAFVELLDKRG